MSAFFVPVLSSMEHYRSLNQIRYEAPGNWSVPFMTNVYFKQYFPMQHKYVQILWSVSMVHARVVHLHISVRNCFVKIIRFYAPIWWVRMMKYSPLILRSSLCFVVMWVHDGFLMDSFHPFTFIFYGCRRGFRGAWVTVWLPQYQRSNSER